MYALALVALLSLASPPESERPETLTYELAMCRGKAPGQLCTMMDGSGGTCTRGPCEEGPCVRCLPSPPNTKAETPIAFLVLGLGATLSVLALVVYMLRRGFKEGERAAPPGPSSHAPRPPEPPQPGDDAPR